MDYLKLSVMQAVGELSTRCPNPDLPDVRGLCQDACAPRRTHYRFKSKIIDCHGEMFQETSFFIGATDEANESFKACTSRLWTSLFMH